MVRKYSIKELLNKGTLFINKKVLVEGWIRSFRYSIFIILNDGSTIKNIQIILPKKLDKRIIKKITIGSSIRVIGIVKKSIGTKQYIELQSLDITIYESVDSKIIQKSILQPKKHSLKKLREQAHLRFRTNIFGCIMRIRHNIAFCIHKYFHENGFFYLHTPIITTSNCEGTGKMFQITTMDLKKEPIDYEKDFFKCKTYLSVSGQLEAESASLGLGKVYTFGPVFRAENSNTSRHLSEFWMIEPEIAFYHLEENINLAETFLKFIIRYIIENSMEDLVFLNQCLDNKGNQKKKNFLLEKLELILKFSFKKISYTEVIKLLDQEEKKKNIKFLHPIIWGMDLQSEHEQYLVDKYFKIPVIVFDYPCNIKAFYMRMNNDGKTVRAMDILFPGIGEILGGSQREERYDILLQRMKDTNTDKNKLWWYLDTRRFGSVPHSGFGLGFDRLVQFITGMNNIRDVIPFPRTPNNAEF
ncbi:asparagine--tRNA ligase [Blattabacterium cuenoti]|uniref:asparagine--tRNA ligase n=1 Tax=Blattabacterium cuenoti TaxID=1653831 RepID=UPI00163BBE15|nr:asparagine--tRNA ligase [Blattabacterium cuenoti]